MPTIAGPCEDCGEETRRYVRPGKKLRCFECSIQASIRQQIRAATPGTEENLKAAAAGRATADQIRAREGPLYERWRGGMQACLGPLKDTG